MALADPQSITVGSAVTLPRIVTGEKSAQYANADGTIELLVSHQVVRGRRRTLVKAGRKKVSTDPLTDVKSELGAVINISIDRPAVGFTEAELIELCTGAFGWNTAGTNANLKKVLGLES
jgi:hypothetical protein